MVSVPADPPRGGDMHVVVMPDGARIRTAAWRPAGTPRATVILLNGRTEFIEKYHEVIRELGARDLAVWTCDWRGQGLSSRSLDNPHKGHIDDYVTYLDDLFTLLDTDLPEFAVEPRVMLGHSLGGHLALRILRERPGAFAACVLSAPLIDLPAGKLLGRPVHALCRAAIQAGLSRHYFPGQGNFGKRQRRFAGNVLTGDPARFHRMLGYLDDNPSLVLGGVTVGWLNATLASIATLAQSDYPEAIGEPVLLVSAAQDRMVSNAAQARIVKRLPRGRLLSIGESRHELLMETAFIRGAFWTAFDGFIGDLL